ncbi:MAG: O-antigen ligase family protein [Vicingaceae bacterium]
MLYSRALLSIGQLTLAGAFVLEGKWGEKWKGLTTNKWVLLFIGLYLIHFIGLINTTNWHYAYLDLRVKIPLLLFPIILSTGLRISEQLFHKLNLFFVVLVLSRTLAISLHYYLNKDHIIDMRDAFFLISHIRFSLMISLALFMLLRMILTSNNLNVLASALIIIWFLLFMIFFELLTGLLITFLIAPIALFHLTSRNSKSTKGLRWLAWLATVILLLTTLMAGIKVREFANLQEFNENRDLEVTQSGRAYQQAYTWGNGILMKENGNLVFQNVCFEELEKMWNQEGRSTLDYSDTAYTSTEIILVRFLASKNLTKDSAGFAQLNQEEISAIEHGVTNVLHMNKTGIEVRLMKTIWEMDNYSFGADFSGHSLAMRFEFWKTGWHAFKRNFWTGVGTGDVEEEMQAQYQIDNSTLAQDWRYRSHNQFISIGLALGVLGFAYLWATCIIPLLAKKHDYLYLVFMLIALISMMAEDTLETQIGVGFFAFFNSYFFFRKQP